MLRSIFTILLEFFVIIVSAQTITIPANSGYAVPAEKDDESPMFSSKNGLQQWTDTKQQISYYFYLRSVGELNISLNTKNKSAGSTLKLSVAGKDMMLNIPSSKDFKNIKAGKVSVKDSGFYTITLTAVKKRWSNYCRYPVDRIIRFCYCQYALQPKTKA